MMMLTFLPVLLSVIPMSRSNDATSKSKLLGFRISKYSSFFPFSCSEDMLVPELSEGTEVTIRIVGHLDDVKKVAFTSSTDSCETVFPETITLLEKESNEVGSITITTPTNLPKKNTTLYYCFGNGEKDGWKHQGAAYWAKIIIVQRFTTLYALIIGSILSIFFATALNTSLLSFLSLNISELRAKAESGNEKEKMVCRALISLRKRGYLMVMALVPAIVFFKTAITLFLRIIFSGWLAILVSTILITVFVEVIPRVWKCKGNNSEFVEERTGPLTDGIQTQTRS